MFDLKFDEYGKLVPNESYKEIHRLNKMLDESGIPHTFKPVCDGWQVVYPANGDYRVADAIEHFGSYGKEEDRLEIMGLLTPEESECDSVLGYLTAEEVFNRIKTHWGAHWKEL